MRRRKSTTQLAHLSDPAAHVAVSRHKSLDLGGRGGCSEMMSLQLILQWPQQSMCTCSFALRLELDLISSGCQQLLEIMWT